LSSITRGTRFDKLFTGIVIGPADRPSFIDDTDQSGKGGSGQRIRLNLITSDYWKVRGGSAKEAKERKGGGAPCTTRTCDLLVRSLTRVQHLVGSSVV
jgi:hypothetical protein